MLMSLRQNAQSTSHQHIGQRVFIGREQFQVLLYYFCRSHIPYYFL